MDPRVTLMLRRSIKIMNETLKELANKKMLAGVKTMINVDLNYHKVATIHSLETRWSIIFTNRSWTTIKNYP
jgi:hypothetical protein